MKLLSLYNRVNLITIVFILLITGYAYYSAISWVLNRQSDKDLKDEEMEITEYVSYNHHLPQTFESKYQQIIFTKVAPNSVQRQFVDTPYFKKWDINNPKRQEYHGDGEYDPGRALITFVTVNGEYYKVFIVQSTAETEDLLRIIFSITISVVLLLVVTLIITNRLILNKLWRPFYSIMNELKSFTITDGREIPKINTSIDEFKRLNQVVIDMAEKARLDYKTLKSFTENASHELLTPIAVINSKLDSLLQTDNFNEAQSKLLNDLYGGVSRLNRLNQSLLLLVKIENGLLNEQKRIELSLLIEEMLIQFEEIFADKELQINTSLNHKEIIASSYLIEILLSNLLTNAVRHNYAMGKIGISLTDEKLEIKNTGDPAPLQAEKIFTRFHKSSGSEGSGLGLTISRQICENFDFSLRYSFSEPYHIFTVMFPKLN